ncbi:hypothetical protein GGI03_003530 [Coemansia sp. RSA 2337]|nr:hypothetical protein H4S03_001272 [Coemansia sp. S3946]KAJ2071939.1 hypothetical protein GGH13_003023 [Coemansia sp. S155-1]KAJ2463949.1 hypothetical protein GGI03_003530 [Coemansia sp. RSA 2337]
MFPLQKLPLHIVKLIVDYVVGSSRLVFDGVEENSQAYKKLLWPLQWVCRNFWVVASSRYYSHIRMDMTNSPIVGPRNTPIFIGSAMHKMVKSVDIELDEWSIYSGKALERLAPVLIGDRLVPLTHTITFLFVSGKPDPNVEAYPVSANIKIDIFVDMIKQMAPMVSEIRVRPKYFDRPPGITTHFGSLISQLYSITGRMDYATVGEATVPVELTLERFNNLTHVKFSLARGTRNWDQFARLTQQNASTLQSIDIEYQAIDVCDLVKDSAGRFLTYPHLLKLRMIESLGNYRRRLSVPSDVVMFPSLEKLFARLQYPFDDDALFRGNAATLKSLDLLLDGQTVSMLSRRNVFTVDSHPKLQQVNLVYLDGALPELFPTVVKYMQFALSIGPKAPVRDFGGFFASAGPVRDYGGFLGNSGLVPALPLLNDNPYIQVLSLPNVPLTFWDVIDLVKSLPLLTDLYAYPMGFGPLPSGVAKSKLPEYVRSKYAPMGERFRCWYLKLHIITDLPLAVKCVLLLALVCPNFDYAAIEPSNRVEFMELMKKAISSKEFKPYRPRLRRLLFRGPQNC